MIKAASKITGVRRACEALCVSRAHYYRLVNKPSTDKLCKVEPKGLRGRPCSLSLEEQERVLNELNSDRFADYAPRHVWAKLLDEGVYLCSWRTMYRLLNKHDAIKERRNIRRHPQYVRPEHSATGPNQVWTWDITYLKGSVRGEYYYLYVVIDIYSRLVVGWFIANCESGEYGARVLEQSYHKQNVKPWQLIVHSDRGAPMKSTCLQKLLNKLDVSQSYSRPRVSNDNPYSESGFKTMKYHMTFPSNFESMEEAKEFCKTYFRWYNNEHYHTGIALFTPAQVHYGDIDSLVQQRQATLDAEFQKNPGRFRNRRVIAKYPEKIVWINKPVNAVEVQTTAVKRELE